LLHASGQLSFAFLVADRAAYFVVWPWHGPRAGNLDCNLYRTAVVLEIFEEVFFVGQHVFVTSVGGARHGAAGRGRCVPAARVRRARAAVRAVGQLARRDFGVSVATVVLAQVFRATGDLLNGHLKCLQLVLTLDADLIVRL